MSTTQEHRYIPRMDAGRGNVTTMVGRLRAAYALHHALSWATSCPLERHRAWPRRAAGRPRAAAARGPMPAAVPWPWCALREQLACTTDDLGHRHGALSERSATRSSVLRVMTVVL